MKRVIIASVDPNLVQQAGRAGLVRPFNDFNYWIVREHLDKNCNTLDEGYEQVYNRTIGNPKSGYYNSFKFAKPRLDSIFNFAEHYHLSVSELVALTKQMVKAYNAIRDNFNAPNNGGREFEEFEADYFSV